MQFTEEIRLAAHLPKHRVAKQIRVAAGVSQELMASKLGVHRVTVARWESGAHSPRGRARARYAALLLEMQKAIAA